ncbi:MAG: hypothetical protein GY835_19415 [bacterium]|nr:hypothetical protein [bacterium]
MGAAEREHLKKEARASAEWYTRQGRIAGTVQAVLQQPAQPTRRTDEPMVPRIWPDQLRVRNTGIHLQEQARVQNLQIFMDRDQERRQQQPAAALTTAVDELMISMAGQQSASVWRGAAAGSDAAACRRPDRG